MLNEKQIYKMIDKDMKEIEISAIGLEETGYPDDNSMSGLADLYTWQEIETLCKVLEIDAVPYWNKLCKAYPILGEVT